MLIRGEATDPIIRRFSPNISHAPPVFNHPVAPTPTLSTHEVTIKHDDDGGPVELTLSHSFDH